MADSVSTVRVAADPSGKGWRLGVIGKRTWTVSHGRCVLAPEQVPLVEEPLYDERRAVLLHDADVLLNRTRVDIVVDGHIYPPAGRTPFDFGVQVGETRRLGRAIGPRRVTLWHDGKLGFSGPEPADKIPLTWESAYGGVDQVARAQIGDPFEEAQRGLGQSPDPRFGLFAYPRNPVGRGYLLEPTPEAVEACQLPLVEDPEQPLTAANLVRGDFVRWPEGPGVAAFGWLSYTYFPRSAMLGAPPLVYDGARIAPTAFFEVKRGEMPPASVRPDRPLAERLGVAVTQSAAIGMRARQADPGDPVVLSGLHGSMPRWAFNLPTERPSMGVRFAGERALELPPARIRTVYLQPDDDRLTLVWTSELVLDAPPGPKRMAGLQHAVMWTR